MPREKGLTYIILKVVWGTYIRKSKSNELGIVRAI